MHQNPSHAGATATATDSPLRTKSMKRGFYEETKDEILKALTRDYCAFHSVRSKEKSNPEWSKWSEGERQDRMDRAVLDRISERKASGRHISCQFKVFENYVPAFDGQKRNLSERKGLIEEQIRILGEQPEYEDDDDEEFIPDHVVEKWRRDAEHRLVEIEPYITSSDAQTPEVEHENDGQDGDESTSQEEDQYANSTKTDEENDNEALSTTATTRGRPLPSPLSLPAKTLQALKQHHLTTPSITSVEKAVRRGPLEKVENGEDIFEWIPTQGWGHRKRSRGGDEGCGTQRQGWVKKVKIEGVKVEKNE